MMLPIMVLLLVLIFVAVRYSLFHAVQCYELTKIEPIEDQIAQLYSDGTTSVRYNAENLYYTGYNYLVENKIKGAYYYCFEDDHMVFLLIKTKQPQNSIDKRTVKGRIVKDEVVTDHIIAGFGSETAFPHICLGIHFPVFHVFLISNSSCVNKTFPISDIFTSDKQGNLRMTKSGQIVHDVIDGTFKIKR